MPTGYTADLTTDTPFEQFALRCARAMGALILMRDDPLDAPIPDEFQVDDYHRKRLDDAISRTARLNEMTLAEAAAEMEKENTAKAASRDESIHREKTLRAAYERMIAMVESWPPPTGEHENFKKFMLEQLRSSLEWDCHPIDKTAKWHAGFCGTPQQWLEQRRTAAAEDEARARKSLQEEIDRVALRNSWIRELRRSLKQA